MRTLALLVLTTLAGGCQDWDGPYRRPNPLPPNPVVVAAIEKKIADNLPEWTVYRRTGTVIAVTEGAEPSNPRQSITFPEDDERGDYDRRLLDGSASLVDYLAIARALAVGGYSLPPWSEQASPQTPAAPEPSEETSSGPENRALARRVREHLLSAIQRHTSEAGCHATCEGSNAVCQQGGKRAFARGIPCTLGDEAPPSDWTRSYGYSWCASGFCQAMSYLAARE